MGIPGVLKNALDWASRPVKSSVLAAIAVEGFFFSLGYAKLDSIRKIFQ
jgi:NAD(P)H-dependent FMN reductase